MIVLFSCLFFYDHYIYIFFFWRSRNSHLLLVRIQNGTAILEDSWTVSYKTNTQLQYKYYSFKLYWPRNFFSAVFLMIRLGLWAFGKKIIKVKVLPFHIILEGTSCQTCLITVKLTWISLLRQCLFGFSIVKWSYFLNWNFNPSNKIFNIVWVDISHSFSLICKMSGL